MGKSFIVNDLDMLTHKLVNLPSPLAASDAATKGYVDGILVTAPVTIYIDGTAGNDANDGTIGSPVATMARAAVLSPRFSNAAVTWLVAAAGTYAFAVCPTLFSGAGFWYLRALSGTRTITVSGACDAGTDANQVTEAGLTVDQYLGHTLEITSGPALGCRRTIMENTTTQILPCRRFEQQNATTALTPATGDTYSIYRPGVVITGFTGTFENLRAFLYDVSFAAVTDPATFGESTIVGSGVEFRGTVHPVFVSSYVSIGMLGWSQDAFDKAIPGEATYYYEAGVATVGDVQVLGRERGCGMVMFDALLNTLHGPIIITDAIFQAYGIFSAITSFNALIKHGGMHWSLGNHNGSVINVRGRSGSTLASGSIFREGVIVANGSWGPNCQLRVEISNTGRGFAFVAGIGGRVALLTSGAMDCSLSGNTITKFFSALRGSAVELGGTWTMTANQSAAALMQFGLCSNLFISGGTATITNTGTAQILSVAAGAAVQTAASPTYTYTGTGGVNIGKGGSLVHESGGSMSMNGPLVVDGGVASVSVNLTNTIASGDAITVQNGGSFTQGGGVLTVTPTSGTALTVKSGGLASLLSGTNTVLTGTGSGVGCKALGLGRVVFDGAPTSVTGPASADLQVAATVLANTVLSAAGEAIIDGAGTSILRSA